MTPQTLLTALNTAYWTVDFRTFCHLTGLDQNEDSLGTFQKFQSASRQLSQLDPSILEALVENQQKAA